MVTPLLPSDPQLIGRYSIQGRLGAGGMGIVYLGQSPGGRPAAIKVISERFGVDDGSLARFRREVEVLQTVRSAYTAALIDCQVEQPPYWFATEYVPGPTLADAIAQHGALPPDAAYRLIAALAEGLTDIHRHGICHRDLKPQNVILASTGPQLIDFGIARSAEHASLTQTGAAIGSPGYWAPEVLERNEVAPPADVFALGASTAYAVTGRKPFGDGTIAAIILRSMNGEIDLDGVEPRLAELLRACVAVEPGYRPTPEQIIESCRSQIPAFQPLGHGHPPAGSLSDAVTVPVPPPVPGMPVPGTPVSGTPVSGMPVSGTPVSGTPVSGTPVSGAVTVTVPSAGAGYPAPPAANPFAPTGPTGPTWPHAPAGPYAAAGPYDATGVLGRAPGAPGAPGPQPAPYGAPNPPRFDATPPGGFPPGAPHHPAPGSRGGRTALWVGAAVVAVILLLGGGAFVLTGLGSDTNSGTDPGPAAARKPTPAAPAASPASPSASASAAPSDSGSESASPPAPADAPASADAPDPDTGGAVTWVDLATTRCLDGDARGTVYTMPCNDGDYQKWTPQQADGGSTFTSKATGLCLDGNKATNVYTMPCNGGDYQVWAIVENGPGHFNLRNKATGFVLDSNADGQVYAFEANDGDYQRWSRRR